MANQTRKTSYDTGRDHAWEVDHATRNVGGTERGERILLGWVCLAAAPSVGSRLFTGLLAAIGIDALITGVTGFSPLNSIIGRDSYHARRPGL